MLSTYSCRLMRRDVTLASGGKQVKPLVVMTYSRCNPIKTLVERSAGLCCPCHYYDCVHCLVSAVHKFDRSPHTKYTAHLANGDQDVRCHRTFMFAPYGEPGHKGPHPRCQGHRFTRLSTAVPRCFCLQQFEPDRKCERCLTVNTPLQSTVHMCDRPQRH